MTKPIVDTATTIAATTAMASATTRFPTDRRVAAIAGRQRPAPRRRTSRQKPRRLPGTSASRARAVSPPRWVSAVVFMGRLGALLGLGPTATMALLRARGVEAESLRRTLNLGPRKVGDAAADGGSRIAGTAFSPSSDRTPTTTTTKKGSQ